MRIVLRFFAHVLVGVVAGILVGAFVPAVQRSMAHPVLTGSYRFEQSRKASIAAMSVQGGTHGLFFAAFISVFAALVAAVARAIRRRQKLFGCRLVGMITGTLVGFMLASGREISMADSLSTLEWRIINPATDLFLFSLCGGILGALLGTMVDRCVGTRAITKA
jgi:F0F1-type ATP synthase assembly protein I